MANRIVLVSDDLDFFDYIRSKLALRKSDELFLFSFDEIPFKTEFLEHAIIIINSENSKEKTLALLKIFSTNPVIVISYNEDNKFKKECYSYGAIDYMTLLTSDDEFKARLIPALSISATLQKSSQYRDLLVKNNILNLNKEVYIDYSKIIESELERIRKTSIKAAFAAISANEKEKFLMQSNTVETIILNNIRKNDILMSYAPNKYFLLMYDTDVESAKNFWDKLQPQFSQKLYAGFAQVANQSKEKLISDVLIQLQQEINSDKTYAKTNKTNKNVPLKSNYNSSPYTNFKFFKQEFSRKIEQVISPVFYEVQQKYSSKLQGMSIEHGNGDGYGVFYIKGKHIVSCLRISSPGFAKINIDITIQKNGEDIDSKRISLEPEELEAGLLGDILEQFVKEVRLKEQ